MVKEGKRVKRSTDVEAADPERELQNSETDVNPKKLKKSKQIDLEPKKKHKKRCSASTSTPTDVEAAGHKGTKSLQKAERELQNPETDVNPKKLKKSKQTDLEPKKKHKKTSEKIKEMKKLRKSFKEMTETMKNLEDVFKLRADLPGMSLKDILLSKAPEDTEEEEEEVPEKTEELECCFETEDSIGNNHDSVFVCNLDTSLAREDLKTALRKHFESCGCEVSRVFVPIQCETGVPLGFAFIDVDDNIKALEGHSRCIGKCLMFIMLAEHRPESTVFPNFSGCKRCGIILDERRVKRFLNYRRHDVR